MSDIPTGNATGNVALFNASDDTVEMVQRILINSGDSQSLIGCHFSDLKKGTVDFQKYMEEYKPEVVIVDISPPYGENWRFYKTMRDSQIMQGRGMVLTTTNKARLDEVARGNSHALEIVGHSLDLDRIQAAIKTQTAKVRYKTGDASSTNDLDSEFPAPLPVVALFNANHDTVDLVARMLSSVGIFCLDACHFADLKTGHVDYSAYLSAHSPSVVIVDISPPYQENWEFFKIMRDSKAMAGRSIVLTTTNKARLDEIVAEDSNAIEIVGKPYDFGEILKAIETALRAHRDAA